MKNEIIIKIVIGKIFSFLYMKIKVTNDKALGIYRKYISKTSCDFRFEDDTRVSTAHLGGIVILLLYQFPVWI